MSLTSYRAAPPRGDGVLLGVVRVPGVWARGAASGGGTRGGRGGGLASLAATCSSAA
jgi:hypothetical protein